MHQPARVKQRISNYRYLLDALPGSSTQNREWIQKSIRREFKSAIAWAEENFYNSAGGSSLSPDEIKDTINKRIKELISYRPWWKLLGFSQEPEDLSAVYASYRRHMAGAETSKRSVFERRAKLYNLALEQSVARFNLNPRVLLLTLGAIKKVIAAQDFEAAEEHVASVTAIARETIWAMLSDEERFAFARYRRGEMNKPVQTLKPTYTQHRLGFYHKSSR